MLEQKQGQFWNLHRIPNKTLNPDFWFFFQFFSGLKKVIAIFIQKSSLIKKKRRKSKIGIQSFVRNLMQIPKQWQNCPCFFFLALIVFDFYSFEGSKTHFTGETNIYICIYWVLLGGFDAINASNQRTIWSCMIFQPSWFILYFIFSINSIVFYEIFYNDVTASRDITMTSCSYLFTDPNKICTAYVKLNSKHILFMRIFRFIFRDNYDYSFHNHKRGRSP